MNPDLQKQLAGLVEDARKAGMSIFDYLQAHSPALVKQILDWYYWSNMIDLLIGTTVFLGFFIPFIVALVKLKRRKYEDCYLWPTVMICGLCALFAFFIGVISNIPPLVKLKVAPDVVLVEQLRRML